MRGATWKLSRFSVSRAADLTSYSQHCRAVAEGPRRLRPEVWAMTEHRPPYADEAMKPTSASLSPPEACSRRVAEGNCVAVRRGGEYPEAKGWSQTQVNLIRPVQRASWRRNRICRGQPRGVLAKLGSMTRPDGGTSHVHAARLALEGVWSGNGRRCHGVSQDRCRRPEKAADDRAPIVALKRLITVERRGVGR